MVKKINNTSDVLYILSKIQIFGRGLMKCFGIHRLAEY